MKTIRFLQAKDGNAIGDIAAYPGVIADKWIARGIATADLTPPPKPRTKRESTPLEAIAPAAQVGKNDDVHLDLISQKLESRPSRAKQAGVRQQEPKAVNEQPTIEIDPYVMGPEPKDK